MFEEGLPLYKKISVTHMKEHVFACPSESSYFQINPCVELRRLLSHRVIKCSYSMIILGSLSVGFTNEKWVLLLKVGLLLFLNERPFNIN